MFLRRRRLQVLLSLLVITIASVYLSFQLLDLGLSSSEQEHSNNPGLVTEAILQLRKNYYKNFDEQQVLLSAATAARSNLLRELSLSEESVPEWSHPNPFDRDRALLRLEVYLQGLNRLVGDRPMMRDVNYSALDGLVETLGDSHTMALDPDQYQHFRKHLKHRTEGDVGLDFRVEGCSFVVRSVSEHGPAASLGVQRGDNLVTLDDLEVLPLACRESVEGKGQAYSLEQLRSALRGQEGSQVKLGLVREGVPFHVEVTRTLAPLKVVSGELIPDEVDVGWIWIHSFSELTQVEFLEECERLESRGANVLVLDLRNNHGGYVAAALDLASVFLASGEPVVGIVGKSERSFRYTFGGTPRTLPLVVVINEKTASAAEILAAAIQEHRRGVLIGWPSVGKATIQNIHEFSDGGCFKLTTAAYCTPQGKTFDGTGLQPDLSLSVREAESEAELRERVLEYCRDKWKNQETKR